MREGRRWSEERRESGEKEGGSGEVAMRLAMRRLQFTNPRATGFSSAAGNERCARPNLATGTAVAEGGRKELCCCCCCCCCCWRPLLNHFLPPPLRCAAMAFRGRSKRHMRSRRRAGPSSGAARANLDVISEISAETSASASSVHESSVSSREDLGTGTGEVESRDPSSQTARRTGGFSLVARRFMAIPALVSVTFLLVALILVGSLVAVGVGALTGAGETGSESRGGGRGGGEGGERGGGGGGEEKEGEVRKAEDRTKLGGGPRADDSRVQRRNRRKSIVAHDLAEVGSSK